MSLTPSLEPLGLKKIDEKYIFILFTAIILAFYVLDPSFYIIFVLYLVYIIKIILGFINYKPKSEVSKMVASQLATVEIHYSYRYALNWPFWSLYSVCISTNVNLQPLF